MEAIGTAVIGLGPASLHLLSELGSASMFDLVAICDETFKLLAPAREKTDAKAYRDTHQLLADDNVELVVIATEPSLRADTAIRSLDAGKHVVIATALGIEPGKVQRMMRSAEERERVLSCRLTSAVDSAYLAIGEAVSEGEVGDVIALHHHVAAQRPGTADGQADIQPIAGALDEYALGLIYQCIELMPAEIRDVCVVTAQRGRRAESAERFCAVLRFRGGSVAVLDADAAACGAFDAWRVVGTEGEIRAARGADEWRAEVLLSGQRRNLEIGVDDVNRFWDGLADSIRGGAGLSVRPGRVMKAIKILDTMTESAESGEVVGL